MVALARPRVRFARPHYAPGMDWSAYRPLLRGWEIVVGDPSAPDALDGVDVLVAAAVNAELIDAGGFGLIQQIGTGTDRIDLDAATEAGVWVSSLPSGLTGNADGVADTAVLLTLARRTVVVVGLGDVGERVVARLRGFGPQLVGVRARPKRGGPSGLDELAGPAALPALAAQADAIILCARFTPGAPPLVDAGVQGVHRRISGTARA